MDAFSHSQKLILAHIWPKMSPALCIMVQFVPHKPQTSLIVCKFQKEDCLGVALTLLKLLDSSLIQHMYKVGRFIPNMVRNFDSSFCFVDISSARHKCHTEHFPLRFISKKVTRQYSNEVNSDFKLELRVGNKRGAHYLLRKRFCIDA